MYWLPHKAILSHCHYNDHFYPFVYPSIHRASSPLYPSFTLLLSSSFIRSPLYSQRISFLMSPEISFWPSGKLLSSLPSLPHPSIYSPSRTSQVDIAVALSILKSSGWFLSFLFWFFLLESPPHFSLLLCHFNRQSHFSFVSTSPSPCFSVRTDVLTLLIKSSETSMTWWRRRKVVTSHAFHIHVASSSSRRRISFL